MKLNENDNAAYEQSTRRTLILFLKPFLYGQHKTYQTEGVPRYYPNHSFLFAISPVRYQSEIINFKL